MADLSSFTVKPGEPFRLADFATEPSASLISKKERKESTRDNLRKLRELHERLYAQGAKSLLIVLQAMDTAGKDGTIKHVLGAFNPQGVHVISFKKPTEEESDHDFLWRIRRQSPAAELTPSPGVPVIDNSHCQRRTR